MTAHTAQLSGFAYGEYLEGPYQRSLGYRLLAPPETVEPWAAEVDALARRLQAAPYPDHWPPVDLFGSVLLTDGRRLIALARYGLADHTASQRRGGLELVGVVGPGSLGVTSALAIYQWLKQRRDQTEDLRSLGGEFALSDVLAAVPPAPPPSEPAPILPIRLWQEGGLLFAATAPTDPDRRLGLLEEGASGTWQWLPLVGPDFPVQTYAQRGPLVAWTPHLAGVAVKLERKPAEEGARPSLLRQVLGVALATVLVLLLAANLWATLDLTRRLPVGITPDRETPRPSPATAPPERADSRERFAQALYRLLQKQGGIDEWNRSQLLAQYERLAVEDESLRVSSSEGKSAVAGVSLLARRSPKQVEAAVREALSNKGYDARLIDLACQRVHDRLLAEMSGP